MAKSDAGLWAAGQEGQERLAFSKVTVASQCQRVAYQLYRHETGFRSVYKQRKLAQHSVLDVKATVWVSPRPAGFTRFMMFRTSAN